MPRSRAGLRRAAIRGSLPVVGATVSALILGQQLGPIEFREISAALGSVGLTAWLLALAASAASFAAVGMYDALFHAWLDTGIRPRRAARTGAAAIALAQTLGFGLATGTLARWRALPELSLRQAFSVTNYVSFSFLAALGVLSALALGLVRPSMPGASVFAGIGIAAALVAAVLSFVPCGHLPFRVPSLRLMLRLLVLTAIDTGFATIALWLLLPDDSLPAFVHLLAAFLLALGAGLLSGTPGGLGPFEVCLLALLPDIPEPDLIASILGFRLVYYALPACLAMLALARPGLAQEAHAPKTGASPVRRAEAGLADLPGHRLARLDDACAVVADTASFRVVIGEAVCGGGLKQSDVETLRRSAHRASLWPALYKIGARSAVAARCQGWRLMVISEEAWLNPQVFSTEGSRMRQLRRKLRQAKAADLHVEAASALPFEQMQAVADQWARRSGGERGFSMGRFSPGYVDQQRVFLAWQGGELVAFVTFHVTAREWTLDLMRSADHATNGVMHALAVHALETAARCGIARVSLAAIPLEAPRGPVAILARRADAQGLRRFKLSFSPERQRLYLAAPNHFLLTLAAVSILLSIRFPTRAGPCKSVKKASMSTS